MSSPPHEMHSDLSAELEGDLLPPVPVEPGPTASAFKGLAGRLARVTSSGRYVPVIDGLRFLAIAAVLLFHIDFLATTAAAPDWKTSGARWADPLHRVLSRGHLGVQLFFVISGFVLGLPFAEQHLRGGRRVGLGRYLLRRVTRIEPPYLICIVLLYATQLARLPEAWGRLPNFLATLGYVHNAMFGEISAINGVAWSLEVEVQFYLLAPLLALVFAVRPRGLRRGVLLGGIAALAAVQMAWALPFGLWASVVGQGGFFLAGFLLADVWVGDWGGEMAAGRAGWDAAALLALAAAFAPVEAVGGAWGAAWSAGAVPCLIALGYYAIFRGRAWRRGLSAAPVAVIGGMCYTIYLWHMPLLQRLSGLPARLLGTATPLWMHTLLLAAIGLPAVGVCCAILFALLERPFMARNWPRRALESLGLRRKSAS